MIKMAVDMGMFIGYTFGDGGSEVSHLQYVDDTLIVRAALQTNIWAIKSLLQIFEVTSSLKFNFFKSHLVGINIEDEWISEATRILNCKIEGVPFKYLGLPIGANPSKKST